MLYQPRYKPGQILCGTGQTVIVTGWTLREAIARYLQPHEFAGIGQLYSPTRGISFLVRNLFCNPHVRSVITIDATQADRNAGGCQCLVDFFQHGVEPGQTDTGRDCWRIRSAIVGFIDPEIPAEAIAQLRQSVTVYPCTSLADAIAQAHHLAQQSSLPAWAEPQEFPLSEGQTLPQPGPRYGHRLEGRTIAETWVKILQRITSIGQVRPTAYDGYWQELIDLVAIVTDEPAGFYFPDPNYLPVSREFLADYQAQILADAPATEKHREGVKYTYGQRLRSWFGVDQIEQVIERLVRDRNSARAVLSLWDAEADGRHSANPPCLNHIWVRIADDTLTLTATFRSNDMYSAWVANAMGLRSLQAHLCDEIATRSGQPLTIGALITISQSAHIYDDCWENARQVIATHYPLLCRDRQFADPSGSFLVGVAGGQITVEQLTPGSGEVVNCWQGKTAKRLYQMIASACPAIELEHGFYLGSELQKAELAAQYSTQFKYEQDKPLAIL